MLTYGSTSIAHSHNTNILTQPLDIQPPYLPPIYPYSMCTLPAQESGWWNNLFKSNTNTNTNRVSKQLSGGGGRGSGSGSSDTDSGDGDGDGVVALIKRGDCMFEDKGAVAQTMGAG